MNSSHSIMEELYNDLFAYRIMMQDLNIDESFIIKELKLYLLRERHNINDINNIIYSFYEYYQIDVSMDTITNTRLFIFTYNNSNNSLSNDSITDNEDNNNEQLNQLTSDASTNTSNNDNNDNIFNDNISNNINDNISNNINDNIFNNSTSFTINNNNNIISLITPLTNISYTNTDLYNLFSQIVENNSSSNIFEDVVVSLDTVDLNNLNIYENNNDNINCAICMDDIKIKDNICELKCNHYFHESCIKIYLDKYNYKCPICREAVGNTKVNI